MDKTKQKDNVVILLRDRRGRFLGRVSGHNLITDTGKTLLRDLIGGLRKWPTHIAVGTGTVAAVAADVALGTEVYRALITRRVQRPFGIKFQLFIPTTDANGNTLTEAALWTVVGSTSTLFARILFTAIAKTSAASLTISWTVDVTAS